MYLCLSHIDVSLSPSLPLSLKKPMEKYPRVKINNNNKKNETGFLSRMHDPSLNCEQGKSRGEFYQGTQPAFVKCSQPSTALHSLATAHVILCLFLFSLSKYLWIFLLNIILFPSCQLLGLYK
uniref:Uncharacterized protein n=1 Tax=Myotis myotis TaxID=51298 RepID=A0A7J7RRX1_MYOMY|nr:hypothetical protein mMyoMyo1_010221 [Myotis myotis]